MTEIATRPMVARNDMECNDTGLVRMAREGSVNLSDEQAGPPMSKQYFVYIMTNKYNKVLYTGFTSDLVKRVNEHKAKLRGGFTSKYNVNKLVYFEEYEDPVAAIDREKQIKGGSRATKIDMIRQMNPGWKDLYEQM